MPAGNLGAPFILEMFRMAEPKQRYHLQSNRNFRL